MNTPGILECTLRDGSYAVDFQFTAQDTAVIAAALEEAGFDMIELGHGLGLNASNRGKGIAAASDEEYLRAAAGTLTRARWGMFFIPGIGRMEDLDLASGYGMDFVRIGTNAGEVGQAERFVHQAKQLGLFVSINLMKSYALPPDQLAEQGRLGEAFGADIVCVVDSAGCMFPDHVGDYVAAMRAKVSVPVGFHGHDNLALATANTLAALDAGATMVDTTLQGIGRGGGNVPTEVLVSVLRKRGAAPEIDLNSLMDISGRLIRPLLGKAGWDPINITSGFAGFHSSYLNVVLKHAHLYGVDPRDLIIGVSGVEQVTISEQLVEEVARGLRERRKAERSGQVKPPAPLSWGIPDSDWTSVPLRERATRVAGVLRGTAKKGGRVSVLNIVAAQDAGAEARVSQFVQERAEYVMGTAEIGDIRQLPEIVDAADGIVDIFFVDTERKWYLQQTLMEDITARARRSRVFGYGDNEVWVRSVELQLRSLLAPVRQPKVVVLGTGALELRLSLLLLEQGLDVWLTGSRAEELQAHADAIGRLAVSAGTVRVHPHPAEAVKGASALITFLRGEGGIGPSVVEALSNEAVILDAAIGGVNEAALTAAFARGIRVIRPDMRDVLAAELAAVVGTERTVRVFMGRGEIAGFPFVAGGIVGKYGDLVLDSFADPAHVVGVADGRGGVIYDIPSEFADRVRRAEQEILKIRARPSQVLTA